MYFVTQKDYIVYQNSASDSYNILAFLQLYWFCQCKNNAVYSLSATLTLIKQ